MNQKYKPLALVLIVLLLGGLLTPEPRLLPALAWRSIGQPDKALAVLERLDEKGSLSWDGLFLQIDLLADQNRFGEGFMALYNYDIDEEKFIPRFSRKEVEVLAKYAGFLWAEGASSNVTGLWEAVQDNGWRGKPWRVYQLALALDVIQSGYSSQTQTIKADCPELALALQAVNIRKVTDFLWSNSWSLSPHRLTSVEACSQLLKGQAGAIRQGIDQLHPAFQDVARDMADAIEALELALQAREGEEDWLTWLLTASPGVYEKFIQSPAGESMTLEQWQQIRAQREQCPITANCYDYWLFKQGLSQSDKTYHWQEVITHPDMVALAWSPTGLLAARYLDPEHRNKLLILDGEGNIIYEYEVEYLSGVYWAPKGERAVVESYYSQIMSYRPHDWENVASVWLMEAPGAELIPLPFTNGDYWQVLAWENETTLKLRNDKSYVDYYYNLNEDTLTPIPDWQNISFSASGQAVGIRGEGLWFGSPENIILKRPTISRLHWSPRGEKLLAEEYSSVLRCWRRWLVTEKGVDELSLPPGTYYGWVEENLLLLRQSFSIPKEDEPSGQLYFFRWLVWDFEKESSSVIRMPFIEEPLYRAGGAPFRILSGTGLMAVNEPLDNGQTILRIYQLEGP